MLTSNLWYILIAFLSSLQVEVVFDMNQFDPNTDLREHPDIRRGPPVWVDSPQYRTREQLCQVLSTCEIDSDWHADARNTL